MLLMSCFVDLFCSESHVQERKQLTQSLDLIHDILTDINERVDARQKQQRLSDICRRIDAKAFTMYRGEKFKVAYRSVQRRSWRGVLGVKTLPE